MLLLAQITPLADLSRVAYHWIFFNIIHFIITLHGSIAATSVSQYKKTKIEQNAINSCHVLQFHVLQLHVLHFHVLHFHALQVGPSISCTAISCPAILMVCHFHARHFQRPPSITPLAFPAKTALLEH